MGKYIPSYAEIKAKVLKEYKVHGKPMQEAVWEDLMAQYMEKYPEQIGRDKALIAYLLARDLGVEVRVVKFRTGAHLKLAELNDGDRGVIIDECYLTAKWDSMTRDGKPAVRFVVIDDTGWAQGVTTGEERISTLNEIPVGSAIGLANVNVLRLRSGINLITVVFDNSSIYKVENPTLPPLDSFRKDIELLEDGRFCIIEGIAVDCSRRTYTGCPNCHSKAKKGVKPGERYKCSKCGEVVAQELAFASLVVNDGTGDVICALSPRLSFDEKLIGTRIEVRGVYNAKSDTIDVSIFKPLGVAMEELIKPKVMKHKVLEEKAVKVPPKKPTEEIVKKKLPVEVEKPPVPVEVPEEILQDILAFLHFVGPMSLDVLDERLKSDRYPEFKGTAEDVAKTLVERGEARVEGRYLKKAR